MSSALSFTQAPPVRRGRSGLIALWVVQIGLAGMFLLAGAGQNDHVVLGIVADVTEGPNQGFVDMAIEHERAAR